jgi:hypothetical protein
LVEPIANEFLGAAGEIPFSKPRIPMMSSVTSEWVDENVTRPEYWWRNLREPVRFYAAAGQLATAGRPRFQEIGAGSTLVSLIRSAFPDQEMLVLPGLTARDDEWDKILDALAQLYVEGAAVNWHSVSAGKGRKISLPGYPFERKRHWFSARSMDIDVGSSSVSGVAVHPLLGKQLDLSLQDIVFEQDMSQLAFLADHRVEERTVFPASGYLPDVNDTRYEICLSSSQSLSRKNRPVACRWCCLWTRKGSNAGSWSRTVTNGGDVPGAVCCPIWMRADRLLPGSRSTNPSKSKTTIVAVRKPDWIIAVCFAALRNCLAATGRPRAGLPHLRDWKSGGICSTQPCWTPASKWQRPF